MSAYADTSFLVSLYAFDIHSDRALRIVEASHPTFLLTPLGEMELAAALELRLFRRQGTRPQLDAAEARFRQHIEMGVYSSQAMPPAVYERARQIARRRCSQLGARTLDILHVAAALLLKAEVFYTFDDRQRTLARAEGLRVR